MWSPSRRPRETPRELSTIPQPVSVVQLGELERLGIAPDALEDIYARLVENPDVDFGWEHVPPPDPDATAAAMLPEGDGYLAALINFRYIANGLWTTEEAVSRITTAA